MSLHNLASQIQSRGRGDDKMLVHMTPGEVQGLQALAMRHGGSLTINPDTGLPEAGFLKRMLPTLIGAGAMMIPGMQPIGAAMLGAGAGFVTSGGNLKAGIMGGLGAWGGASLMGGMMGAGAMGAAESASLLGDAAIAGGETTAGMVGAANTGLPVGTETLGGAVTTGGAGGGSSVGASGPSFSSNFDNLVKGYKATPLNLNYLKENMYPIGAAATSILSGGSDESKAAPVDKGQIRPYTYSQERNPNFGTVPGESYFKQAYTEGQPYAAASGGIVALANGGPVERMSMMNTAMNPQGGLYPQGMIDKTQYATPIQRPVSSEMIETDSAYDRSNPLLMAAGGPAKQTTTISPVQQLQLASAANQASAASQERVPDYGAVSQPVPYNRYSQPAPAQNPAVAQYNQIIADRAANEYVTQPSPLSLLPGGGDRATATDTSKLINEYYLKNLGRQADQPGLDYYNKQKTTTGMSLADINKDISTSGEANIRNFYKQNYDRFATPEEIASVQKRYAGGESPEQIIADLKAKAPVRPATPASKDTTQTDYSYDPVTGKYTAPTAVAKPTEIGGLDMNDPAVQQFIKQQYQNYQNSQSVGGKAGGLMPGALSYARGGIADLGGYSDGGRMLRGPGDGMSDSIPGVIGNKQPARLADGEFVVPADVVSHLGNGSTDAGARKLYSMMDRIRAARTGKKRQAPAVKATRFMPA